MSSWNIAEIFTSINGEGRKAGQLAVFIRFTGCNLNCSYCDTKWANDSNAPFTQMTTEELVSYVKQSGVHNVTLTGGEPLLQKNLGQLIQALYQIEQVRVEIETNGSVSIMEMKQLKPAPSLTVDYKAPSSEMERKMHMQNYELVDSNDTVKFVCGSREDLLKAKEIIDRYELVEKTAVYLSPVFGKIDPDEMVEFMKEAQMNGVNLQLQLHKFIWNPQAKGK